MTGIDCNQTPPTSVVCGWGTQQCLWEHYWSLLVSQNQLHQTAAYCHTVLRQSWGIRRRLTPLRSCIRAPLPACCTQQSRQTAQYDIAVEGTIGRCWLPGGFTSVAIASQTCFFRMFVTELDSLHCKIDAFSEYFSTKQLSSWSEKLLFRPAWLHRVLSPCW